MFIRLVSLVAPVAALTVACGPSVKPDPSGDPMGDDDGTGTDAACPAVHFAATPVTPSIQLLIDRSGSRDTDIGGESRYNAVRDALVDNTNGVVTQLQSHVYFGASLFSSDDPCPTLKSVARTMGNQAGIKNLINSQSPNGDTPTGQSIAAVVADFAANPPPPNSPPIIVLATDGLPNACSGSDTTQGQKDSVAAAKAAYAANIRLFILGVGNGIADGHLQDMANAGAGITAGMPNAPYYLANSPAQLAMAFQQIIGGVVSCDLMITGNIDPTTASEGTVTLDGMTLTYGTDWTFINGNTIELIGAACTTLQQSANPIVDASFPCGSVIF
jgi:hypothetical protein